MKLNFKGNYDYDQKLLLLKYSKTIKLFSSLDVIRAHYCTHQILSEDDCKTIRVALLGLIKYYLQREVTAKGKPFTLNFPEQNA